MNNMPDKNGDITVNEIISYSNASWMSDDYHELQYEMNQKVKYHPNCKKRFLVSPDLL